MAMRVVINGREVTNPAAKAVVGMWAILVAGLVGALLMFLVLPLVGIAVTLTAGLAGVALIALGVGLPVLILGGTVLGVLLAPFAAFRKRIARSNDRVPPAGSLPPGRN